MKKLFFSLMAAVALCAGLVSCDAAEELIMKKLVEPACAKLAGSYDSEDGSTLELTESGNYIYTEAATAGAPAMRDVVTRAESEKKVYVGTYTVESDGFTVTLKGELSGNVNTKEGAAKIQVGSKQIEFKANNEKQKVANESTTQFCRTWNIDPQAKVDGKNVTISSEEYAQYFGSYGYPKQMIISALGTFCVVCNNANYNGTWKIGTAENSIHVEEGTFKGDVPFVVGEYVKVTFNAKDNKGTTHSIVAILEEAK